jgi:hypothetical protein
MLSEGENSLAYSPEPGVFERAGCAHTCARPRLWGKGITIA